MTRQVLGIAGRKGSGKTTLAKALEQHGWVRMAFADEVKELALVLDPVVGFDDDGCTCDLCDPDADHLVRLSDLVGDIGWDSAKPTPEVRRILQVVGTEIGRAIDPNIWVNKLANKIHRLPADAKVVIDDVRFINECNWIRHKMGGYVVRLSGGQEGDGHQSEMEVDRLDPNYDTGRQDWDSPVALDALLEMAGMR